TSAEFYMAGESGDYVLIDSLQSQDFAGSQGQVLINSVGNFTVGRGMYNNSPGDWSNALIDEVRISDRALTESNFLFEPMAALSANLIAHATTPDSSASNFANFWLPLQDFAATRAEELSEALVWQDVSFTSGEAWFT